MKVTLHKLGRASEGQGFLAKRGAEQDEAEPYTKMQFDYYESKAGRWTTEDRNFVVGLFNEHNEASCYDVMLEGFDTSRMKMLDFGCGPARNIVKLAGDFKEFDGVDISQRNLTNAETWLRKNEGLFREDQEINLYQCNGADLAEIKSDQYDMVYSTIVLQHIPIHKLRLRYFKEFFRVLKPGGWISLQMGFYSGPREGRAAVSYHANKWGARGTNGRCDVSIDDPEDLRKDIEDEVGFENFSYSMSHPIPKDSKIHTNWIYFRAQKPKFDPVNYLSSMD
tara:strand:- start:32 stop:871 length:840 start_codon:yes stop_codon:yes gene_type:complete